MKIIGIDIPKDASDIRVTFFNSIKYKTNGEYEDWSPMRGYYFNTIFGENKKFEIIGTCQLIKDKITYDFDVTKYFINEESFTSALETMGIYFQNPMKEKPSHYDYINIDEFGEHLFDWDLIEGKLIKGKCLLIKDISINYSTQ